MHTGSRLLVAVGACALLIVMPCRSQLPTSVTVPVILDHNRMLVDAEIQRVDGSWRSARLWIDTGNPDFFMNESLARDLGIALPESGENAEVPPLEGVRIDAMPLDFGAVKTMVMGTPHFTFSAMHYDANLPSTVLRRYQVVLDYPGRRLTLAAPGTLKPRGTRAPAGIHPETGILQIDALVDGDSLSFALDNGASYSFVSSEVLETLLQRHPTWPHVTGATGCANMWGWWPPGEQTLPVLRLPEILWGPVRLTDVAIVGVSQVWENGPSLGVWYSRKTARPVDGFLGANAFMAFRVEIDYEDGFVYFARGAEPDAHDMDLVGLTLRPESDGSFRVIGIASRDGAPVVEGVQPGDLLLQVDDRVTRGATMGEVVDALRGEPGDLRELKLERDGERFTVRTIVERIL